MKYFISSLFFISIIFSQWSTNPSSPQSLGSGVQAQLAATSDGGVYVAWLSDGNNYQVFLQRLNSMGEPQLSDNGMVVSNNANASWIAVYHLNLAVDSEDNAIITTMDQRAGGAWEVYAYKISSDGTMLWGNDGVSLTSSSVSNMSPRLTVLPDNSAVVAWTHNDDTVLFQRISSDGALLWDTGILIEDNNATLISPQPIVTSDGNVLIQWIRQTGPFWASNSQLYLQKYDYDGTAEWSNPVVAAGPVVFPMGNWLQQSVADDISGSFSAWTEMSGNVQNARAQHINDEGELSWTGGVDLSTNSSNFRISPQLTFSENSQELMAVWKESNGSQSQRGVSAQRLDSNGDRLWGSNGTSVVDLNSNYDYLDLNIAGFGDDLIATYIEQSGNMNGNIYATRLDVNGDNVWMGGTVAVTNSNTSKSDMMITNGPGCVFIAWTEGGSIYAHCLLTDGTLGVPIIEEIIDTTYVPDDNFEQALIDLGYDDVLDDYVITDSINTVTTLDVSNDSISDLTGIEDFIALTSLNCSYNQLTTLNVSSNTALISLDVSSNTALTSLYCNDNQLTSLDVSSNTALTHLECNGNQLTSLDVSSNTSLTFLDCNGNDLTSLGITTNTALTHLNCSYNQLTSLDVRSNTALTYLHCGNNQFTSLDVSMNTALTQLALGGNQLTSLDVINNTSLTLLSCPENQLTSMDISNNTSLTQIDCYENQLDSLDVSNNTSLTWLQCYGNQLNYLNMRNGVTDALTTFHATGNDSLECIQTLDPTYATENWTYANGNIDEGVIFSIDCVTPVGYTFVPDDNFEQALIDLSYDDVLDDSVLTANITGIISLDVSNDSISDMTGIEDFIALISLNCRQNQLTSLDVSSNTALNILNCGYNQLTSLDVSMNTALTLLICSVNNLTNLDVSSNTSLINLQCSYNQLTSLDVNNNTALIALHCGGNQLTNLDVSSNIALTGLVPAENQLISLDVSSNTALNFLDCRSNQLTSLDVSSNTALTGLDCQVNQLTYLNMKNGITDQLSQFNANGNLLSCIETLDSTYATENWTYANGNIDEGVIFAETCAQVSIDMDIIPIKFQLYNAFPNPFNPVTTLRYDLPENSLVNITIYDMMGREVKTLVNQSQDAGYRSVIWDATNDYGKPVSAGIYLYQIQTGKHISTKKMVLLK